MKSRQTGANGARSVILSSEAFYESSRDVRFPLVYAAASAVVGGMLLGGVSAVVDLTGLSSVFSSVSLVVILASLFGYTSFLCHVVCTHAVVSAFGERGLKRTVEALAYPTALLLSVGWIPVLNLIAIVYGFSMQAKGLQNRHRMSGFLASSAVVLGGVFGIISFIALSFIIVLVLTLLMPGMSGYF